MHPVIYILAFVAYFIFRIYRESQKMKKQAQAQVENLPPLKERQPVTHKKQETSGRGPIFKKQEKPDSREEYRQKEKVQKQEPRHLQQKHSGKYKADAEAQSMEAIFSEAEQARKYELSVREAQADEHLSPYAMQAKGKNKYAALLKNSQSVKTAFVLSEILHRKY